MILRYAAILLSLVTILSLNLILLLGAVVHDHQSIRSAFDGLVLVIDLSFVSSSGLLAFLMGRNKILAGLFVLNIGILVVAAVLRTSGMILSPLVLYAADIYWLNLYLVSLARYWPTIVAGDS